MSSDQNTSRVWNSRRIEKQRRLASVPGRAKVLPADQLKEILES